MTQKACVARHSCNVLILWPYMTWPWPLLSIRFTVICYLPHQLGSRLTKFELSAVISSVTEADKAKVTILSFDLTLIWHVTFSDFFKCSKSTHRELSTAASSVSLRQPVRELNRGGRICPPRPPPPKPSGARSAKNSSVARVKWQNTHVSIP